MNNACDAKSKYISFFEWILYNNKIETLPGLSNSMTLLSKHFQLVFFLWKGQQVSWQKPNNKASLTHKRTLVLVSPELVAQKYKKINFRNPFYANHILFFWIALRQEIRTDLRQWSKFFCSEKYEIKLRNIWK